MHIRIASLRPLLLAFIAVQLLGASHAQSQATRTWVSGVGDDANPCSRTAPCKTFAGAISKTAAGGEINVLDPGGFGGVTITKSISIEAEGVLAGILVSGTNAVVIAAGVNDHVVLRGLTIEGVGTGLDGIRFLSGSTLHVENCTINNFISNGIDFVPNSVSHLFVKDTMIRNSGQEAIRIHTSPGGFAIGSLDRVRLEKNHDGLKVEDGTRVAVRDSVAVSNTLDGFGAFSTSGTVDLSLDNSLSMENSGNGVEASGGGASVKISNMTITDNNVGLQSTGLIYSFGNNRVSFNGADGSPNVTFAMK